MNNEDDLEGIINRYNYDMNVYILFFIAKISLLQEFTEY